MFINGVIALCVLCYILSR